MNPDPIPVQGLNFDDQKLKKIIPLEKFFFLSLLIKNCNLHVSKLQEKPSALKREQPALQKVKFFNFFLCLWVIFAILDPDPDTDPGTPFYPDPQHWVVLFYTKRLSRKHRKNSFGLVCVVDRIISRFLHQCGSGSGELNQCGSMRIRIRCKKLKLKEFTLCT
jgi:hypothetical protein